MDRETKKIVFWIFIPIGVFLIFGLIYLFVLFKAVDSYGPCGTNDGPFKAKVISNFESGDSSTVFQLSGNGELVLHNRGDTLCPILTLLENGKKVWSLDTDVRNTKKYKDCRIWNISNVTVTKDSNPIELSFIAHWTYGAERGTMEIDRKTGDNSFCLSW
ncbi:MAG: hypothetical protein H0W61_16940 [Bacteroidetes bacterium]|nr:hypothetical protein [Bacteroidota bacterium]